MANTKINGNNGQKKPFNVICTYHKVLKDKKKTSESRVESVKKEVEFLEMLRGYKLCCLNIAEETHDFYRDLDNYELYDMQHSTELIQINVEAYKNKKLEMAKTVTDASKMLNDLKVKLHDANNAACTMRNCLKSILGFTDENIPEEINKITGSAKSLSENGQKAAEALIKIAGIQTFSNADSLKSFGQKLVDVVKLLKSASDEFIKKAAEEAKIAQVDLTKTIKDLNQIEFDDFGAKNSLNAVSSSIKFICEGQCQPIDEVGEICRKISKDTQNDNNRDAKPWKDKDQH